LFQRWKALVADALHTAYDKKKPLRSFFYKLVRIIYASFKSFRANELNLKASLITFYSLISLVPILTIIFAIAKGFGFDEFLQKQLLQTFHEQKDVIATALKFSYAIIEHIKNQAIVGFGIFFLFFGVFGLFENIEKSLNTIWHVKKTRGFLRRSINYMMALVFFPVIFISSTSITIFINAEVVRTAQQYEFLSSISYYVIWFLKLAPYALMCALFSYIYLFTPNAKIFVWPRIIAGIIAGTVFQLWQILYIGFQVYISSYNIIYGSFAALPLFVIWMQVNFLILLSGAAIAAQIEGDRFFKKNEDKDRFKVVNQKLLSLIILHEITSRFLKGQKPVSIQYVSQHLGVSSLEAREVLNLLEKAGIIAEIGYSEKYQLIVNPELFTLQSVSLLLEKGMLKKTWVRETIPYRVVINSFSQFDQSIQNSKENLNLKDFALTRISSTEIP
jgi:membrane protein